jgi:hypothetical protein
MSSVRDGSDRRPEVQMVEDAPDNFKVQIEVNKGWLARQEAFLSVLNEMIEDMKRNLKSRALPQR